MGYRLHLAFAPAWAQLVKSYSLMGNWNLLWYAVAALVVFGWRQLTKPPLLPLAVVAAAGLSFLFFVFAFTDAAAWLGDLTAANRATMQIVPMLVLLGVRTCHEMTLVPSAEMASTAAAEPST